MKRIREVMCGVLLVVLAATPALAQIKPVGPGRMNFTDSKTGVNFRFGISLDFQPMFVDELDFNDKTNYRSITEFGSFGDNDSLIGFESRLFFTATKGNVSLYTALETDGSLDEQVIDNNQPNVERLQLSWFLPQLNTKFSVGADIYGVDMIGRMVYLDDDPGIWFTGGAGPWHWRGGWHKRQEFGGSAGTGGQAGRSRIGIFEDREDDTNILTLAIGYDLTHPAGRFRIEPFGMYYGRNNPHTGGGQTRLNLVGPNGVTRPGTDPLQNSLVGIVQNQESWFAGIQGTGNIGLLKPTFEFVYFTGNVDGLKLRPATCTGTVTASCPYGFDDFDIQSWAWYFRLDFDVSKQPWWPLRGVIPFVAVDWARGDDNPSDNDLEGFVTPSSPNGLRGPDIPMLRKTAMGLGSPIVGDLTADFGFSTDARGTGPTIGNILEGGTLGGTGFFNNRAGKGDNPGYIWLRGGIEGRYNPKWRLFLVAEHFRYEDTESIEREFASFGVTDVDEEIGTQFDVMVEYNPQPAYAFRPFFSIFFPGDGVETISGDDETAIVAGVNFFTIF